jgi:hypothetical protein
MLSLQPHPNPSSPFLNFKQTLEEKKIFSLPFRISETQRQNLKFRAKILSLPALRDCLQRQNADASTEGVARRGRAWLSTGSQVMIDDHLHLGIPSSSSSSWRSDLLSTVAYTIRNREASVICLDMATNP